MPLRLDMPEYPFGLDDFHILSELRALDTGLMRRVARDGTKDSHPLRPIWQEIHEIRKKTCRIIYPHTANLFPLTLSGTTLEYIGSDREAHFGVRTMADVMPRVQQFMLCEAGLWWKHPPMKKWDDLCRHADDLKLTLKKHRLGRKSPRIIPVLRFNPKELSWKPEAIFLGFPKTETAVQLALGEDGFSRMPPS